MNDRRTAAARYRYVNAAAAAIRTAAAIRHASPLISATAERAATDAAATAADGIGAECVNAWHSACGHYAAAAQQWRAAIVSTDDAAIVAAMNAAADACRHAAECAENYADAAAMAAAE